MCPSCAHDGAEKGHEEVRKCNSEGKVIAHKQGAFGGANEKSQIAQSSVGYCEILFVVFCIIIVGSSSIMDTLNSNLPRSSRLDTLHLAATILSCASSLRRTRVQIQSEAFTLDNPEEACHSPWAASHSPQEGLREGPTQALARGCNLLVRSLPSHSAVARAQCFEGVRRK